jgi:pumilio family protein 6
LRHGNHATFRKAATAVIASSTKLVPSKFGLEVVNAVYAHKLTTALERNLLTLSILRDNIAVMKSWRGYPVLEDMLRLETTHAKRLSAALFKVADKFTSQKDVAHLPFVQRLLCALFTVGVEDEVQEVAATLSQNITPLVASREGALLVAKLFTVGAVTKRRDVLRQVAAAFEDIVLTKQGAPMFAHMLDMVYDAQISAKFISGPIVAALPAVLSSPYAHLVILHLLTPDLGRKEKALLPGWLDEFNLYSRENSGWNKHTWHRADGEEAGTVEVCTQPAEKSHAIALKVLLPAIAEFVKKTEDMAGAKLGVTRIAKELHHLIDSKDPLLEHVELDAETVRILLAQVPKKVAKGDAAEELIATAVAAVELIPKVAGVRRPRSVSAAPRKEAAPKASDDAAPKEASARRAIPEKTTAAVTARKPDAKKKPTVTTFETDE